MFVYQVVTKKQIGFYVSHNSLGALTQNSTKGCENGYYFNITFALFFKLKII
jgi:hypothetical protein